MIDKREIVVFDFDGTLVSKDTGYEFNKWLIQKSILRTVLMLAFLPIVGLLITNSCSRTFGLNIGCYIATAFQKKSLFKLRAQFIQYYFSVAGAVAYSKGLDEMSNHQKRGRSVLIISGCPHWLLHGAVKYLGIVDATIIGSRSKVAYGALLVQKHCYRKNKLEMSKDLGAEYSHWVVGYSDSKADIPMLRACVTKVLVNVAPRKIGQFKQHLSEPIEVREWA
jgi:phosphatidylglycerophosphatase C